MKKLFQSEETDINDIMARDKFLILHGVNCCGTMGAGVAKVLYTKFPLIRRKYVKMFESHLSGEPAKVLGYSQIVTVGSEQQIIINGFTQTYYGSDGGVYADEDAITQCVTSALHTAFHRKLKEVHIPLIGYGLGGLGGKVFEAFNKAVTQANKNLTPSLCPTLVVVYRSDDLKNNKDLEYLREKSTYS